MSQQSPTRVRVRTPATSANLGPGFDAAGLALELYDEVEVAVRGDDHVAVRIDGEGADELPRDAAHLVVRAMRATFEAEGERLPGVDVECVNRVPHGRGLGSSASAIVAGVTAARVLLGRENGGDELDRDRVFELAARIEGHPDNVAPCVYGGFTLAWRTGEEWRALPLAPSPRVRPVVCVPEERLSTEAARGLLPESVPYGAASFTAGRAALLVAAVTGHPELLLDATADQLHQSYREPAMPASVRLIRELREREGIPAVISGAGPTVLALTTSPGEAVAGDAGRISQDHVDSISEVAGTSWHIRPIKIDPAGVWISSPRSLTCVEE
ncbi:homoserine kinase [Halostreptopolyspora alba]|uniref:Homoserine kinase n=1 Tax=Halostreptopolyspora alba TaxID=2487137 RepID=A0A3N0E9Q8_9ACTN|nr:homoserine kinase [Nocardiopsaceae bacterium YIM 96095]